MHKFTDGGVMERIRASDNLMATRKTRMRKKSVRKGSKGLVIKLYTIGSHALFIGFHSEKTELERKWIALSPC